MFDVNGPEGFFMRECFSKERIEKAYNLITIFGWDFQDACNDQGLDADEVAELDKMLEEEGY
jgi:hypothetical protein